MTIRTQIINALLARLRGVTQAGGYRSNVGATVKLNSNKDTEALAVDETLACVVRDTGGQEVAGMAGENVGVIELTLSIVSKQVESVDADEICRFSHADILQAIGTDKTFGGLADDFLMGTADFVTVQGGEVAATITHNCRAIYRTARWNPNEQPT